jgi:tetratricopeptide (TPR) repeat protein
MAYYSQAVLFSKGGKASDAEKAYVAGLRRRPDHPPSLYNLAVLQRDAGRAAEAEANYRRALAAEPDYALAHNGLATLLWDLPVRERSGLRATLT